MAAILLDTREREEGEQDSCSVRPRCLPSPPKLGDKPLVGAMLVLLLAVGGTGEVSILSLEESVGGGEGRSFPSLDSFFPSISPSSLPSPAMSGSSPSLAALASLFKVLVVVLV